ncbi:hypothetical protein tinsulaeT_15860 [Thalassotalea insulae]|uniref:OmpR/PhoB-type domain-containing protein n=1 Tax=Thalassotalea insulae TaxID=2056778 RepID=A0ABQ6GVN8_9GAMM|nr:winged helix-turn-helix domain-containing protein [Thalassotalea insulae]GLX78246.1 hypothetical protein tinsulaeT_15860 [Thalassotalea insulae]
MRWQIAEYIFCDQQQNLVSEHGVQQLEPMMVELLSYFCQHPDQIVSKDQLIEQVWLGRIVTDNAVSRLVTKLRKVFDDDARQPTFIATFPKKGYKFIAPVGRLTDKKALAVQENRLAESESQFEPNDVSSELLHSQASELTAAPGLMAQTKLITVLFVAAIVLFGLWWQLLRHSTQVPANYAKLITSDAGDEMFPAFSPDGTRLAYMLMKADGIHLMVKNIQDESVVEIEHGKGVGVGPADWSDDGKQIVYLVATPERCQYFIRSVEGQKFGQPQLIHNCPAGSYGGIIFSHENHRLIYAENHGNNSPYSLFEINLITNKTKRLNQPQVYLGGNNQFDLHPSDNKLLISSPDKQQWEGFYSLDLDSEQLILLFKQDAYICCGIWDHSGERVVLMGEHPAYQLLSYDLAGQDRQVIYSGSREIHWPRRHSNGRDYLFSSGTDNANIHLLNLVTEKQQVIADAVVDERLASFANKSQQLAYISLASGSEEIWLFDQKSQQRKKLSYFNDGRHYIDLMWSPTDEHLLGLTLNEIHLIDAVSGEFKRLKISQNEIRGVSFKAENVISYSVKEQNQWQVYYYQLATDSVTAAESQWQFIQYHTNPENTLWLDQDDQLYAGVQPHAVNNQQLAKQLLSGRQFNLKKRGDLWFWFERSKSSGIISYNEISGQTQQLVETFAVHFDIANNQLLFSNTELVNTNIYQTQALVAE